MSGAGRGRGWLLLNKSNSPPPPGEPEPVQEDNFALANLSLSPPPVLLKDHSSFIAKLDEVMLFSNPRDKLCSIYESFEEMYSSEEDFSDCVQLIYSRCLKDVNFGKKMVVLMPYFRGGATRIIWKMFITCLQQDFERKEQMQKTCPVSFRNYVIIFAKFVKYNLFTNQISIYFFDCCNTLIQTGDPLDLELCVKQLNNVSIFLKQNEISGCYKSQLDLKLQDLIVKVHRRLLDDDLQRVSRAWLLLAVEILTRDFEKMPMPIYQFFTKQLGTEAMKDFQHTFSMLSVDVSDKSPLPLECYNNISVLQCLSNDKSSISEPKQEEQCKKDKQHEIEQEHGQKIQCQKQQRGRPILGTGARHQNSAGSKKAASGDGADSGGGSNSKLNSYNKNKNTNQTGVQESVQTF